MTIIYLTIVTDYFQSEWIGTVVLYIPRNYLHGCSGFNNWQQGALPTKGKNERTRRKSLKWRKKSSTNLFVLLSGPSLYAA